ncbi:hypothetical protein [Salisediminibacterium beveridgei]|uniref:Uncharacterized protein n=1 Tax=Salisediminibacterium beveridgei TaxID=632773 RepID=A0A1D7QZN9_9BACI|nr:hypothetical protein [Salisediminibacterium beveridgei]AOM84481.1 hypothetical protein BBEV_3165 [Salisediminibacterium beveridgei]
MDFVLYLGAIGAWGFIRYEQNQFKLLSFLLECLLIGIALFILQWAVGATLSFVTMPIPENVTFWIAGLIFFIGVCYVSLKSWRITQQSD